MRWVLGAVLAIGCAGKPAAPTESPPATAAAIDAAVTDELVSVDACDFELACLIEIAERDPAAYDRAGIALWYGVDVEQDRVRAVELWRKGCEADDPSSCAQLLQEGRVTDAGERRRYYQKVRKIWGGRCDLGDQSACADYTRFVSAPTMVWRETMTMLCRRGLVKHCAELVERSVFDGSFGELPGWVVDQVRPTLRERCESDGPACAALATLAGTDDEAVAWLERGCERGHEPTCGRLTDRLRGLGRPAWVPLAVRMCADGNAHECSELAQAFPPGHPHYHRVLDLQCEAGAGMACGRLALELGEQAKTRGERERVAELWRRACGNGQPAACEVYASHVRKLGKARTRAQRRELHRFLCVEGARPEHCAEARKLGWRNREKSVEMKRCMAGSARDCWTVAQAAVRDKDRRRKALERGCALGDFVACRAAGKYEQACAAGKGIAEGCLAMAARLEPEERLRWCKYACAAWRFRDQSSDRISHDNPGDDPVCQAIERCE